MTTGTSLKFNASHQAVVVLLGLGAILVLPLARTRLLKLYWQGTTIAFPSCACHPSCLGPDLYSKCSCTSITTLGQLPE